ncbi:MAG: glutathione S-transferase N-terminal domain-containing protein, partial [Pseudomonas alloputida]
MTLVSGRCSVYKVHANPLRPGGCFVMLKLYGFSVSNYYNMVKLALLEKGLPFEEVTFYGGQAPQALEVSPRG